MQEGQNIVLSVEKIFLELCQSQVVGQVEPCDVDITLEADVQPHPPKKASTNSNVKVIVLQLLSEGETTGFIARYLLHMPLFLICSDLSLCHWLQ